MRLSALIDLLEEMKTMEGDVKTDVTGIHVRADHNEAHPGPVVILVKG